MEDLYDGPLDDHPQIHWACFTFEQIPAAEANSPKTFVQQPPSPKMPRVPKSFPFPWAWSKHLDRYLPLSPPMQPWFVPQSSCSVAPLPCWKQKTPAGLGEIVARCVYLLEDWSDKVGRCWTFQKIPRIIEKTRFNSKAKVFTLLVPKLLPTSTNLQTHEDT